MFSTILLKNFRKASYSMKGLHRVKPKHMLHAMLASSGYELQTDVAYSWHGRRRGNATFAIFQYTISGRGHLQVDGVTHLAEPGTAMLLTVPEDNHYWLAEGDSWEFFHVSLYGSEVMRAWTAAIQRLGHLPALPWESSVVQNAASIFMQMRENKVQNPFAASALAYALAMDLLATAVSPGGDRPEARPAAIERAVHYIRDHLAEPIGLDDMAAVAGMSRYHFSRCFRDSEGVPPGEYLMAKRLQQAVHLLQTTRHSLESIANQCGYRDVNYFVRAFRKAMGITPGSFRRSGM